MDSRQRQRAQKRWTRDEFDKEARKAGGRAKDKRVAWVIGLLGLLGFIGLGGYWVIELLGLLGF